MKKIFFITGIILFFLLVSLIVIFSTTGYETDKFNRIISEKINESNKKISLKLEKIKFKFDIKNLSLFLETNSPDLKYQNLTIPIKSAKVYLDLFSLIKSETKISKINIKSKEVKINQLKKIVIKTKPSNLNSFITNKIKNGKLTSNLELYFNNKQKIEQTQSPN